MRITKYVHSCLLVETPKLKVLIDPGGFSWDSHLLKIQELDQLDFIVITHEHGDHYHPEFVKVLASTFPHATIVTNTELAAKIAELGIANPISSGSQENIQVFDAPHDPLAFNRPLPKQIGVHIDDKLTHPGDTVNIGPSREIFALPITGPWVSHKAALEAVAVLKPKTVIPVHDWFWHKEARDFMYKMSAELLAPHGIEFAPLENGVAKDF